MADSENDPTGPRGSGPLYQQSDAGRRAADEPVKIPGQDDAEDDAVNVTGKKQAAANREADPPA